MTLKVGAPNETVHNYRALQ